MRNMTSIEEVLESIENLAIDDQAYVLEVLSRRLIDRRRQAIKKRAEEAEQAYKRGKVKMGTFRDLLKDLND